MRHIAAIVDCTGSNSQIPDHGYMRMMHQTSVIKKILDVLRQAGVRQILVMTGDNHEDMELHLAHRGVELLRSGSGMDRFAHRKRAMEILEMSVTPDVLLMMSGSMPLIRKDEIRSLLQRKEDLAVLKGAEEEDAPMVISRRIMEMILEGEIEEISAEAVRGAGWKTAEIRTRDPRSVMAVTTEENYQRILEAEREEIDARRMGFQVKLMVSRGDRNLGPGVIRFLELIDETGSMSAACKSMEMSYSRGWTLIKNVEDQMGFLFLERKSGGKGSGSSRLTPKGREFVDAFAAMQEDLDRMAETLFARHFGDKFE